MIWSVPKSLDLKDDFDIDKFNTINFVGIRDIDKEKINNFVNANFYNTALEFLYNKTITILHNTLKQLKEYNICRFSIIFEPANISFLGGIYILNSANNLGLISSKEYKEITKLIEFIQTVKTLDINRKVTKSEFVYFLKICCQAVFCKDYKEFITTYTDFAKSLYMQEMLPLSQLYIDIIESDNKKIKVVIQLLCILIAEKYNDILDKNVSIIVPAIMSNFSVRDKLTLSYYLRDYKNYAEKYIKLIDIVGDLRAFEKVYIKCKEINYIHFDTSGYALESSLLNNLLDNILITNDYSVLVIPIIILAYVGNEYSINTNSRLVAEKYLNTITIDRWNNYFKNYFFDNFYLLVSLFESKIKIKALCDMVNYIYAEEEKPNIDIVNYCINKDLKSLWEIINKKFLR